VGKAKWSYFLQSQRVGFMGRKATQFPDGVSVEGDRIVIRFSWNGERCRETYAYPATPKNIERAGNLRSEIAQRIRFKNFTLSDYKKYFPHSKRVETMGTAPMFGRIAQDWLDAIEVSAATRDEYRKAINRYWMPLYAEREIDSIAYSELRKDVNSIEWTSAKTRNNMLIPLRGIFEMAHVDEIIDKNPADKLRNMKHQKLPVDPFTRDEAELIIKTLYDQYRADEAIHAAYFEFEFFTGMRASEALALRWEDIDLRKAYARVAKAQSKGRLNTQTKNARSRDVALNERALHALQVAKSLTYLAGGCVFASSRSGEGFKTEKSQRYVFTRVLKKIGMRHRPAKNCRHTYATMLLMSGANINFVAAQLGHSVTMTATIYGKWISGKADAKELAKLPAYA